ncbi:DUF5808 domain-containing protein [Alteromonas sp. 14N.309.X.WAT.G.H12]|uniref:DUF5808 domain-containing protein n=1 Tax=Alteromonas sp. 14N.309.X.WAT.G.H12 TaxID=3120824 RepID=UPI003A598C8D
MISFIVIFIYLIIELYLVNKIKVDRKHPIFNYIYFDSEDLRIFVPKKSGLGYTFNFAHLICRISTYFILSILITGIYVLIGR